MSALFFYIFSGILIASALMVVVGRNPVHSVLYLILAFVNAAGLFVLLGAEFLAMILIVVYVGAVAVLFLFVVMMLDVDFVELRQGFQKYLPFGTIIAIVFAAELVVVLGAFVVDPSMVKAPLQIAPAASGDTNTAMLGRVLYTKYAYFFQAAGMILLVAMVGAIVLTLRERVGVKRQNVAAQVARTRATAIEVRKVPSRQGL